VLRSPQQLTAALQLTAAQQLISPGQLTGGADMDPALVTHTPGQQPRRPEGKKIVSYMSMLH
jgi:hypothetical protein